MKKLKLSREVVRMLSSRELQSAHGGVDTGSGIECQNTVLSCGDTQRASNCNGCAPTVGCNTVTWVTCPALTTFC